MAPETVRGVNPEPEGGWPWHLTPYEVSYVETFRVRPVREGTWENAPEKNARLDAEAEGVLAVISAGRQSIAAPEPSVVLPQPAQQPARMRARTFTIAVVSLAIVAIAAGVATLVLQLEEASQQKELKKLYRVFDGHSTSLEQLVEMAKEQGIELPRF